jgi:hypothetical protein
VKRGEERADESRRDRRAAAKPSRSTPGNARTRRRDEPPSAIKYPAT